MEQIDVKRILDTEQISGLDAHALKVKREVLILHNTVEEKYKTVLKSVFGSNFTPQEIVDKLGGQLSLSLIQLMELVENLLQTSSPSYRPFENPYDIAVDSKTGAITITPKVVESEE